jgi:hypothetical protein
MILLNIFAMVHIFYSCGEGLMRKNIMMMSQSKHISLTMSEKSPFSNTIQFEKSDWAVLSLRGDDRYRVRYQYHVHFSIILIHNE